VCPDQELNPRVTLVAVRDSGAPPPMRAGEPLRSRRFTLGDDFTSDYAARAGDDLAIYADLGIAHPVTWPQIANRIFSTDLVNGPWIHTRSIVRHHAPGRLGDTVDAHATVVARFRRGGTRAVADVLIEHDGRPIATLEHEAIVDLTPAD
jgi:acyl dehydratase